MHFRIAVVSLALLSVCSCEITKIGGRFINPLTGGALESEFGEFDHQSYKTVAVVAKSKKDQSLCSIAKNTFSTHLQSKGYAVADQDQAEKLRELMEDNLGRSTEESDFKAGQAKDVFALIVLDIAEIEKKKRDRKSAELVDSCSAVITARVLAVENNGQLSTAIARGVAALGSPSDAVKNAANFLGEDFPSLSD